VDKLGTGEEVREYRETRRHAERREKNDKTPGLGRQEAFWGGGGIEKAKKGSSRSIQESEIDEELAPQKTVKKSGPIRNGQRDKRTRPGNQVPKIRKKKRINPKKNRDGL